MKERLDIMREEMDALNETLLRVFLERMELSRRIIRFKGSQGVGVCDPERENAIVNAMEEAAGPDAAPYVRSLFRAVLELSRAYSQTPPPRP